MNINKLMQQMQKAQTAQAEIQEKLAGIEVIGQVSGNLVQITANGQGTIQAIKLNKSVVDPEDVEALEDLILAAIQDAQKKAGELQNSEMQKLVGGLFK